MQPTIRNFDRPRPIEFECLGHPTLGSALTRPACPTHAQVAQASAIGRGCVKTQDGTCSQNIGLPKRAVFDYFWLGIGRKAPEFEIELSFYTASADSGHVGRRPEAAGRL